MVLVIHPLRIEHLKELKALHFVDIIALLCA